ncbi:unnamed protein product [Cuscuta epithymum]|uniref:mRNA export factor GLE1 n=1 Tax=Cuscuta epithymum TaxID=186058 RepID=A0AAV0F9I8_9ASTE|nr:unnamed protein product [Cuscuta epithymum]
MSPDASPHIIYMYRLYHFYSSKGNCIMVGVKLKPRVPEDINGITLDPQPDWSFDALLLELSSIERKVAASPKFPAYTKICSREHYDSKSGALRQGFVMKAPSDCEDEVSEQSVTPGMQITCDNLYSREHYASKSGALRQGFVMKAPSDCEDEVSEQPVTPGMQITCDNLYSSDGQISEDEASFEVDLHPMERVGWVEGALSALTCEHRLNVMENVRNKISAFQTALLDEHHIFSSKLQMVEKDYEAVSKIDRWLDMQYQRKTAEALEDHLISVRRDHEHRSQIEERRIRHDAALELAERTEKAFKEEIWLETNRTEQEVQPKVIEDVGKKKEKTVELEAQRKDVEEAAEENTSENVKNIATGHHKVSDQAAEFGQNVHNSSQSASSTHFGSAEMTNQEVCKSQLESMGKGISQFQLLVPGRSIKAAKNALDIEKERSMLYMELIVKNEALGLGTKTEYKRHEIEIRRRLRIISGLEQNVPLAMDIILAELNKNCIYTVPKHLMYSQSDFLNQRAYCIAIGYQVEEDGKIETDSSYLNRLCAYMKLYWAIVQTEVEGFQNMHGHREGWAWLARLLNAVPANVYTVVALNAFLEVAGFGLHRRYKHHFEKLLNILTSRDFLKALDEGLQSHIVVTELHSYFESKGGHLADHLLSNTAVISINTCVA